MSDDFMQGPRTPEEKKRRIRECDRCHKRFATNHLQREEKLGDYLCYPCVRKMEERKKKRWEAGSLIAQQRQ